MFLFSLFSTLVLSCSDKTSESTEDALTPTEGEWRFAELAYTDDACNLADTAIYSTASFESNVYTLTNVSDTEVMYVDNYDIVFDCTRDGTVITCPNAFTGAVESYNDQDGNVVLDDNGNPVVPDATNTFETLFITTLSSADAGTLSATITTTCEGEDCALVWESTGVMADPCTSKLSGNSSLQ